MSQSAKTAIGGMTAALSVVLMLPTVMGLWTYALPAFAGILIMFTIIELDKKWATGIFVAVSLLSFILLPNKEAAVFYLCFFGNYPIIKGVLEGRKMPRVLEYIIKFVVFNAEILLAGFIMVKIFGVPMAEFLFSASVCFNIHSAIMSAISPYILFAFLYLSIAQGKSIYIKSFFSTLPSDILSLTL